MIARQEKPGGKKPANSVSAGRMAAWVLAALAVAGIVICCSLSRNDEEETAGTEKATRNETPSAVEPVPTDETIDGKVVGAASAKPAKKEPELFVKRPGAMQLPNGKVLTFPPPKEGEIRKVYANGRMYECDSEGNFKDVTRRKLFKTAFELNFLALAQEGKPYIPVFLKNLDEDEVKKILLKDYVPIGDETEEEWAQLRAYDDMRCAALDYMEQGGKFDDFVDEYAKFDRQQRMARAMGLREIMTLYKAGKVEEAKEMAEAANLLMEKKGFKPVQLPPHVQAAFDEM